MTRARSLANRASDIVSVRDFGAVGDGTGNDSTAIQAAIDYAKSNNISLTAGATPCANFEPNTSRILFFQIPSGGGAAATIAYDAAGYIMVSGSYTV